MKRNWFQRQIDRLLGRTYFTGIDYSSESESYYVVTYLDRHGVLHVVDEGRLSS